MALSTFVLPFFSNLRMGFISSMVRACDGMDDDEFLVDGDVMADDDSARV